MGGRGASSGMSVKGNKYGSQYHTLYQDGNVKFVTKNSRQSEDLMETMTDGRIYATVNGGEVQRITFFDKDKKRNKVLEYDKRRKEWHGHSGYLHSEHSEKEHEELTASDQKIIDDIRQKWNNRP